MNRKGQCHEFFRLRSFPIKKLLLVLKHVQKRFRTLKKIFLELLVFVLDSLVMNAQGTSIFSNTNQMYQKGKSKLQSIFRTIVPFKVVLYLFKSVKGLPGGQNDSPVMKTMGSLDSTVMNTPES